MQLTKISLVTPSFNQGKFISRTIEAVLNQRYCNFEYIIMDGASKDETVSIIEKHKDHLSYWESCADKGQSDAINRGFAKASGDWLCWVNADDVLFADALVKVADCSGRYPKVDIITANTVYIDETDHITRCIRTPKQNWSFLKYGVGVFTAPAVFFKKKLFEKVGGLDISLHYSMDIDLWHKFCLANAEVCHIDDYLGAFRMHTLSKTGTFRAGAKKAFENPETTITRIRYLPRVNWRLILLLRVLHKIYRMVRLDYLRGWIDLKKNNGKSWQEVFPVK